MRILIIDNFCNLSGAPRVCAKLADVLKEHKVFICCIRRAGDGFYTPDLAGSRLKQPHLGYLLGIICLLSSFRFWKEIISADKIILNTTLCAPFLPILLMLKKRPIVYAHETFPKNFVYRICMFLVRKLADKIVAPSSTVFKKIYTHKLHVIPNSIDNKFLDCKPVLRSPNVVKRILFLGIGRLEKGSRIYERDFAGASNNYKIVTNKLLAEQNALPQSFEAEFFQEFDFVLVIEDRDYWEETFSLVMFEAAASGCVPLTNMKELSKEFWKSTPEIYVKNRDELDELILTLNESHAYRNLVKRAATIANEVCDDISYRESWLKLLSVQ